MGLSLVSRFPVTLGSNEKIGGSNMGGVRPSLPKAGLATAKLLRKK